MASKRVKKYGKQWLARRKRNGIEYCLGLYHSQQEAIQAERQFDERWPPYRRLA